MSDISQGSMIGLLAKGVLQLVLCWLKMLQL